MGNGDNFALDWIRGELESTLDQARAALESYAEGGREETRLRSCLTSLHQVHGTLRMLELEGVVLLAVNQQEDSATAIDYFRELGLTFTPVLDEDGGIGQQYQIGRTLPTTFFINEAGEVSVVHRGPMTFGQIEGYIADTLNTQ